MGERRGRNPDIAVTLVVLKQYVVFRAVLFNQRAFENQRLKLVVGNDVLKTVDFGHHPAHLLALSRVRAEILADAVFQRFGLSDIYNVVLGIFHDVNAGLPRQRQRLPAQLIHFFGLFHDAPPQFA